MIGPLCLAQHGTNIFTQSSQVVAVAPDNCMSLQCDRKAQRYEFLTDENTLFVNQIV